MTQRGIEALVAKVEALPDPQSRKAALELTQAIMDLHASGLERVLEILWAREDGQRAIDALGEDPTVSSLLVLHDLHPLDLEARIRRALPANAELISIIGGFVRVRVSRGLDSRSAVEASLLEAAPDAAGVQIEETTATPGFVPLDALLAGSC